VERSNPRFRFTYDRHAIAARLDGFASLAMTETAAFLACPS
jgi:hypothetical protein